MAHKFLILSSQRLSNKKSGLSYDGFMHHGKYKNFLVKASSHSLPNVICFYSNQNGHMVSHYSIRKGSFKQIWVPKGTIPNVPNPQGPKLA